MSYRVLADHARAVSFLLADGVYPSNEGRGYVLRRILRRAVRHAWLLGRREPTLAPLTAVVVEQLGGAYPELIAKAAYIHEVTETEEVRFLETIEGGLRRLDEIFASGATAISGAEAFKLYDTFGFPIDLTQIIAGEQGVEVDLEGFERALDKQRKRSRRGSRGGCVGRPAGGGQARGARPQAGKVAFRQARQAEVRRLRSHRGRHRRAGVPAGGLPGRAAAAENPFYAESGGQVSDVGAVTGRGVGRSPSTRRAQGSRQGTVVGGSLEQSFDPATLHAAVDAPRRHDIERNHSATHLVHYALRKHLGPHVRQQGSLVLPDRLRFDFSHHGPIDPGNLQAIERR